MLDEGTDLVHVHDGGNHREVAATIEVGYEALPAAGSTAGIPIVVEDVHTVGVRPSTAGEHGRARAERVRG